MFSARQLARLPPSTLALVLATLARLAASHALPPPLPVETVTVAHRLIAAAPYPPLPTAAPLSPAELRDLRRRQQFNTVCGFIGGDPLLPATCSAGSHCVVDQEHGAIGCCPNGGPCTAGVFTGCVDFNSGPQSVVNPYVFTCAGSDVCYKNVFEGGFSQFGCGTASGLATTVAASATGLSAPLVLSSLSVPFTESTTSLATPVTINPSTGTRPFTQSTETGSSSAQSTRSQTSSGSSHASSSTVLQTSSSSASTTVTKTQTASPSMQTTTSPSLQTSDPAAPVSTSENHSNRTGAIIGGTISGVAILVAVVAVGIFLCRRRSRNARQGPGLKGNTEYISPASGPQFMPVHQNQYGYETGMAPGTTTNITGGPWQGVPPMAPAQTYPGHHPGAMAAAGAGGFAAGTAGSMRAADEMPLTQDVGDMHGLNDFSNNYRTALRQINEEEESPGDDVNGHPMNANGYNGNGNGSDNGETGSGAEGRPLWHQNRRRSRNMMWM